MNKDKITITYILITITILIAASVYIYSIDIGRNNAQISQGAERVYGSSKDYSKKIYSMVSVYSDEIGEYFSEENATEKRAKALVTKPSVVVERKKRVITIRQKKPNSKPVIISKQLNDNVHTGEGNTSKTKKFTITSSAQQTKENK